MPGGGSGKGIIGAVARFGSGNILVQVGNAIYKGIKFADKLNSTGAGSGLAGETFDFALGMCANEGQITLVNQIGPSGFEDAISIAIENGRDATGVLTDMTDHPEAIGDILDEAEAMINDAFSTGRFE